MAIARIETDGIEDGAVDSSKILDGTLGAADIPNDTLTNTKFSNSAAIPTSKLTGLATSATTDTTSATNITSGSLATARVNVGTTAGKILQVDGSGNMPAIDGSQITGVESFTKSASDPTISTNPSGGVGTEWVNTTSGEIYLCTDATAGENVWTNVGAGTGDIEPWSFAGTNFGYCSGSFAPPAPYSRDWIQKFSFTSDANATDSGNLTTPNWGGAGIGSRTHGYCAGGYYHNNGGSINVIDKFSFAVGGNAVDVGDITVARNYAMATSDKSTYGYVHGGESYTNVIDRFSLTADGNAVDVGDLTQAKGWAAAASTQSYGYGAGGWTGSATNVIERYQMQASANGVDVGDLALTSGHGATGVTSDTHGYFIRVATANPSGQDIQKYALSSSANATTVGDSPVANARYKSGTTSTTHGYLAGGDYTTVTDQIEKFSLSTDGNSVAIADLAYGADEGQAGTEY